MRRNDLDIMADLVKITAIGCNKTRLVYQGNLNFFIVKKYIKRMIEGGLMEKKGAFFYSTQKGAEFLQNYQATRALI